MSRPEQRPSMFAAAAADAFTRDVMATARRHPAQVVAMEGMLETLVGTLLDTGRGAGAKRRVSLVGVDPGCSLTPGVCS